jgi:hypothetical protein
MLQVNDNVEKVLFQKIDKHISHLERAVKALIGRIESFDLKEKLKDETFQSKIDELGLFQDDIENAIREVKFYIDLLKG